MATANLINVLCEVYPNDTIADLQRHVVYDLGAIEILQKYIDEGSAGENAKKRFYRKKG